MAKLRSTSQVVDIESIAQRLLNTVDKIAQLKELESTLRKALVPLVENKGGELKIGDRKIQTVKGRKSWTFSENVSNMKIQLKALQEQEKATGVAKCKEGAKTLRITGGN